MEKPTTMLNGGGTIEKDPQGRGMKQGGDPTVEFRREPSPLEEIKNILPLD